MIDLDKLEAIAKAAPQGEWEIHTSNSWRRVMARDRGNTVRVIEPTNHPMDKWPDLIFGNGVDAYLEAMQPTTMLALIDEVRKLREALAAINVIRNSIIGLQTLNWSEHVYPLVAALEAAGVEGMGYPEARKFFGTMLDRCNAAEDDAERYRFLRATTKAIRDDFGNERTEVTPEKFDEAVDAARKAQEQKTC